MKSAFAITFNEERHEYTGNGLIMPSVTQAIERAGLSDFSMVNQDVLRRARIFGTETHKACEMYDRRQMPKPDPQVLPYLEGWIKFLRDSGFRQDKIEVMVHSRKFWFAGKADRIGWFREDYSVLEIKVANCYYPSFELQTAAYKMANNEMEPRADRKVRKRYIIQLFPGRYQITPCEDANDEAVFLSCLQVANFRAKHNMK